MRTGGQDQSTGEAELDVGNVARNAAELDALLWAVLRACLGNTDEAGLVVAGQPPAWMADRLAELAQRWPARWPGLGDFAREAHRALELRGRVVHDPPVVVAPGPAPGAASRPTARPGVRFRAFSTRELTDA